MQLETPQREVVNTINQTYTNVYTRAQHAESRENRKQQPMNYASIVHVSVTKRDKLLIVPQITTRLCLLLLILDFTSLP